MRHKHKEPETSFAKVTTVSQVGRLSHAIINPSRHTVFVFISRLSTSALAVDQPRLEEYMHAATRMLDEATHPTLTSRLSFPCRLMAFNFGISLSLRSDVAHQTMSWRPPYRCNFISGTCSSCSSIACSHPTLYKLRA